MGKMKIQYDSGFLLDLGTLASFDAVAGTFRIDGSRGSGFRVSRSVFFLRFTGKTATEGPIIWGLSMNLTPALVEAAIEADPQTPSDDDSRGDGGWIKPCGIIGLEETAGRLTDFGGLVVNPNWSCIEAQNYQLWAYNQDTSTLTTGMRIHGFAEHMGVWLRD